MAVPRTPAELVKLVTDLAGKPASFYDLARRLHELHAASSSDFRKITTNGVVGRRRAYQMVRIARVFGPSKIPAPDLEAVGFTKLNLLAEKNEKGSVLTTAEVEFLVDWAAQHTVKALQDRLAKDPDKQKKRVVAIYLTQAEYSLYRAAMMKFGAPPVGKGLGGAGDGAHEVDRQPEGG
ncbi:hypothetical protein [Methylobacterium sp. WL6]|uniref:hypothetical protein n=1 Tax=Methylobacterium sp. WL6 TaxID=2603901 RepID=UPI0011C84714|nr:hypothetical protein [Methylobacterium sp. WL6]TXN72852.1 hypothetical protein FV230_03525 [Methylobacterium sp. WL6]